MQFQRSALFSLATMTALAGCDLREFHHGSMTDSDPTTSGLSTTSDSGTGSVATSRKVDLVFIVDDTGTMGDAQGRLASIMAPLIDQIEGDPGQDWRIGVTTTDTGNPGCVRASSAPGQLLMSSCLGRLDDFNFLDQVSDACEDHCSLSTFEVLPTSTDVEPVPRVHPWLEVGGGLRNVVDDPREVASCMVPRGLVGCGFEAPLEALFAFITGAQTEGNENYGFLREDAHLVVVFVTDETDCSAQDQTIFSTQRALWADPADRAPTSAVCWNGGTRCEGDPSSLSCHAADYASDGTPAESPDDAVLYPLSRYRDVLEHVAAQKSDFGARVATFAIAGVPTDFHETGHLEFVHDGSETDLFYGIASVCDSEELVAIPPVRILEVLADQGPVANYAFSICNSDYAPMVSRIVSELGL